MKDIVNNAKLGLAGNALGAISIPLTHINAVLGVVTGVAGCVLAIFSALNSIDTWRERRADKRRLREELEARIDAERERYLASLDESLDEHVDGPQS